MFGSPLEGGVLFSVIVSWVIRFRWSIGMWFGEWEFSSRVAKVLDISSVFVAILLFIRSVVFVELAMPLSFLISSQNLPPSLTSSLSQTAIHFFCLYIDISRRMDAFKRFHSVLMVGFLVR